MRELTTDGHPLILALDVGGRPIDWMTWQDAACLQVRAQIAWTAGRTTIVVRGGVNQARGERSRLDLNSIMAIRNARAHFDAHAAPALTNVQLFRRDRGTCLYCGETLSPAHLTRDHVIPTSRGGADVWGNVVTACRPCNARKDNRTPDEAGLVLLALPYPPSRVEALLLKNKKVLADQMEFLLQHVPRQRRFAY